MAESNFKIKGPFALVIVAGLIVFRLLSIGESDDPDLKSAVERQLLSHMGGSVSDMLADIDPEDGAQIDELLEMSDMSAIEIHSMRVSKPLFGGFGSSVEAIVRVDFTLPGQAEETEYWRFTHSTAAGWRYRRPASIAIYYLNFI